MTKNKHDHTATKKIKAWLFAIMLLLPFLFLIPTAFYYGFNEHAQAQEHINEVPVYYETNTIESSSDLTIGNAYTWLDNIESGTYVSETLFSVSLQEEDFKVIYPEQTYSTNYTFAIGYNGTYFAMYTYNPNYQFGANINNKQFRFVLNSILNQNNLNYIYSHIGTCSNLIKEYVDETYTMSITDSMSTAWTNTWSNPLFSWTNNSPFYTPMSNFTNIFGIDNMQIANVLTYLATITAIYIVFDIVIELFTYLTHLIPRSD